MRLGYASIFAAAWVVGWFAPAPGSSGMGLSAWAGPHYTRDRIDGTWATELFRRMHAVSRPADMASAPPADVAATGSVSAVPRMTKLPLLIPVSLGPPAAAPGEDDGELRREELRPGLERLARKMRQEGAEEQPVPGSR